MLLRSAVSVLGSSNWRNGAMSCATWEDGGPGAPACPCLRMPKVASAPSRSRACLPCTRGGKTCKSLDSSCRFARSHARTVGFEWCRQPFALRTSRDTTLSGTRCARSYCPPPKRGTKGLHGSSARHDFWEPGWAGFALSGEAHAAPSLLGQLGGCSPGAPWGSCLVALSTARV